MLLPPTMILTFYPASVYLTAASKLKAPEHSPFGNNSMNEVKIFPLSESQKVFDSSHALPDVIKRFEAKGFPIHLATHQFNGDNAAEEYCAMHTHADEHEINIILGDAGFEYIIGLGKDTHSVTESSAIWIPAGTPHSANVKKGKGIFICIRMTCAIPNQ